RRDPAALEVQLRESRGAERQSPSGAQGQRMHGRRFPLGGDRRTEPGLPAHLVQAKGGVQPESRCEGEVVANGGGAEAAPVRAGGPLDPLAAAGEKKAERVRIAGGQGQLAFRASARGAL